MASEPAPAPRPGLQVKLRRPYAPPPRDPDAPPILSVIVPARDAAGHLAASVARLRGTLEAAGEPWEVLVVDEGSLDPTPRLAEEMAATDPFVKVVRLEGRRGIGAVLRAGIARARGDFVTVSPVGYPLDAESLRALRDTMDPFASYAYFPGRGAVDVAVGYRPSRPDAGSGARVAAWIYRMGLRVAFGMTLRDFHWICMYRRSLFDEVSIDADGPAALPEILVKARRAGRVVRQVPCAMRPAGEARRHGLPELTPAGLLGVAALRVKTLGRPAPREAPPGGAARPA